MINKLKNQLSKKCNKCFFLQENSCILYRNIYLPCHMRVRKIKKVDDIKFYINMVNSRKISIRALYLSMAALLVSSIGTIVSYLTNHST